MDCFMTLIIHFMLISCLILSLFIKISEMDSPLKATKTWGRGVKNTPPSRIDALLKNSPGAFFIGRFYRRSGDYRMTLDGQPAHLQIGLANRSFQRVSYSSSLTYLTCLERL